MRSLDILDINLKLVQVFMILGFLKFLSFFGYLFEFEFGLVPSSTEPGWSLEVYIFLAGVWWSSLDATRVSLLRSLSLLPHVSWFVWCCVISFLLPWWTWSWLWWLVVFLVGALYFLILIDLSFSSLLIG